MFYKCVFSRTRFIVCVPSRCTDNYNFNFVQANIFNEYQSAGDQANYIKCVNRIAVTLKSFPKHLLRTYQFNVLKIVNEILPKLQESSGDLDGDTRQLLLGLFLF